MDWFLLLQKALVENPGRPVAYQLDFLAMPVHHFSQKSRSLSIVARGNQDRTARCIDRDSFIQPIFSPKPSLFPAVPNRITPTDKTPVTRNGPL